MTETFPLLSSTALAPSLKEALHHADDGELFLESQTNEHVHFDDNTLKEASFHTTKGFGLRALAGEASFYIHSPLLTDTALCEASQTLKRLVRTSASSAQVHQAMHTQAPSLLATNHTTATQFPDKVALLQKMNAFARALDSRVVQVTLSWGLKKQDVAIARLDQGPVYDQRIYSTLRSIITVEENGRRERGYVSLGKKDESTFLQEGVWKKQLKEALRRALVNLQAVPAPAGQMPVVLGNGITGILLHEAVGHGLEADFNRKGHSIFSDKMEKQVAHPDVTVIDDGRLDLGMANNHGSLAVDDEGTPTQKTVLIEKGVMTGHMSDRLNARLMGKNSSGNGRRQSYAHLPMPRMTNTYMAPGDATFEDMLQDVDKGIYAVGFNGGQVDIVSGNFVFATSEAYLIEKGKITKPVKGVTLIGNGPETMKKVRMVGQDLLLDPGVGYCGKNGQTALVGLGQPSCLVSEMTVGGTET